MSVRPWYHKTSIYQIYPRSFYDSNADGIGDLPGILQKLDYLQALGFETLWISPFFASPQADLGYDVSNYTDIAPEYGTMADARQLIAEVHGRGMRIIFDLVLNHTSDQHPWFKESRASRDNPKADWYIWRDQPNNWQSITGGSGWHYAEERGQYFWSTFLPFQPDLNYRNPEVKRTMLEIVRFWLAQGVDGFRLDIFNFIYKDAKLRNNPFAVKLLPNDDDASAFFQRAEYTMNQPESFHFAQELRNVCDEFGEKLSIGEVSGGTPIIRKFLGGESNNGLTLVFDFGMLNFEFTAAYFRELIHKMEKYYPDPFMPVYAFSNHDKHRSLYKLGNDLRKAKLLALFQLTVRGVPCLYYGEELGMTNAVFKFQQAHDPIPRKFSFVPRLVTEALGVLANRDEVRTPMQWDETTNAGFSRERPWLPVHENYANVNVKKADGDPDSLLNTVRTLMNLRKQEGAFQEGALELLDQLPASVLGYSRTQNGEKLFVLLNFSHQPVDLEFPHHKVIFGLMAQVTQKEKAIRLDGCGGVILKK